MTELLTRGGLSCGIPRPAGISPHLSQLAAAAVVAVAVAVATATKKYQKSHNFTTTRQKTLEMSNK